MATSSSKRVRADLLLLKRGLAESRSRAQALLLSGRVFVGEVRIEKAGSLLPHDAQVSLRMPPRFVSRGGEKLEGALDTLGLDMSGTVVADIGASTGGFTDCVLQRGARRVYAIDVGRGQLAQRLRDDERVVVMERTNARHLTRESLPEAVQWVVVDASFISLKLLLEPIGALLEPAGQLLALIKPQFEVGREQASKGRGVVRDQVVRQRALYDVFEAVSSAGFERLGDCESTVVGPKGNVEHFVWARKRDV